MESNVQRGMAVGGVSRVGASGDRKRQLASKSILKEFTNHAYYALTYIIMHNTISSITVFHSVALSIGGY